MLKSRNRNKPTRAPWKTVAILTAVIILLVVLRQFPDFIERYYATGIYPLVCRVMHPVFNVMPFSVGDVLYVAAVVFILCAFVNILRLLFTRRFKQTGTFLLKLCIGFEVAYLAFYLFWGLNYFRPAAAQRLNLTDTSYTLANVHAVTAMLIDSANATRSRLDTADLHQPNKISYQTAVDAIAALGKTSAEFKSYSPHIKSSLLPWFMNYMGTSGYYNPFTSESQINGQMPVVDIPFVACHELSHQVGFAREDEANFVGFIAGIGSPNRLLQYSAYYAGIEEFMRYLRRRDTVAHRELRLKISPLVISDFKADSAYWTKYQGNTAMVSGAFYDQFLKANNQPMGLRTYNRMIRLTMAWYRKRWKTQQ